MKGVKRNLDIITSLLALLFTGSLLAAGCSKGTVSDRANSGAAGDSQVKLVALAGTDAAVLDALDVAVKPAPGGFNVTVTAKPEMQALRELYFRLEFDGDALYSNDIKVDALNAEAGIIGLAVEGEPGKLDFGLLATPEAKIPAVSPGALLLSCQLIKGGTERELSGIDSDIYKAQNLGLTQSAGGQWVLAWDYTNPGDTNQDGMVGVQDLSPIGQYFGQSVENSWEDPKRNVDCDRNGVISMGDVVRIGQNYSNRVYAYKVEVSADGQTAFNVIGERLLSEAEKLPGQALRLEYSFPLINGQSNYIENAWYRVVPFQEDLTLGTPSNAICQSGREVDANIAATVQVYCEGLDADKPFAHLNTVRIEYPSSYSYVPGSANTGSIGGAKDAVDGIWATFAKSVLFPPDSMIATFDLGNGRTAIELGMASLERNLPGAPTGSGDIINFQLKNNGTDPLVLSFVKQTDDGIKRTYYADNEGNEFWFDDHIKFGIYY